MSTNRFVTRKTYFIAVALGLVMFLFCFIVGWHASGYTDAYPEGDRCCQTKDILNSLERAIEDWRKDHGSLPESLVHGSFKGFFVEFDDQGQVSDSWHNPIVYKIDGDDYELISYGADGKPGGVWFNSDISNRKLFPPESFPPLFGVFLFSEYGAYAIVTGLLAGGFCFLSTLLVLREEERSTDLPEKKLVSIARNVYSVSSKCVGMVGIILLSIIIAFFLGAIYFGPSSGP